MDGGWITESLVESAVKGCVLVSHGRHHKLPQSGCGFKQQHIFLSRFWRPENRDQVFTRTGFLCELWGESLFFASLLASGGSYNPWPSLASDTSPNLCPCLPITSCSMSEGLKISSAFLFKRIPVIGFGVYPESKMISSWDSYFNYIHKDFFSKQSHIHRLWESEHILSTEWGWGALFNPLQGPSGGFQREFDLTRYVLKDHSVSCVEYSGRDKGESIEMTHFPHRFHCFPFNNCGHEWWVCQDNDRSVFIHVENFQH